jgi:hypothetical protein
MDSNKKTKKTPAEKLADRVRPLKPVDEADAYDKALTMLADWQDETSAEDVWSRSTKGRTVQDMQARAREAARILFPK